MLDIFCTCATILAIHEGRHVKIRASLSREHHAMNTQLHLVEVVII